MTNYTSPLILNQFDMAPVTGQGTMIAPGETLTCSVDPSQSTPLVAGQAVKLSTTANGVPQVIALAANTDKSFGFVLRNLKDQSFSADNPLEIAITDSIMWMTAGAAITRGGSVEVAFATNTVIASAGVNPIVGIALDTATTNGDLIRVLIKTPSIVSQTAAVQEVEVTATLAQINAGLVLIPGQTGQKITVLNYTAIVTGNFATGTSVELESTNVSPVAVTTIAEAGLTNNAVLGPTSANTTLGAGFATAMGSGDGLQVVNNGSAQTGGTNIKFTITYKQA